MTVSRRKNKIGTYEIGANTITEPEEELDADEAALIARIDQLIEVHGGDLRAVIETLLLAYDERVEQVSEGYARGRRRA